MTEEQKTDETRRAAALKRHRRRTLPVAERPVETQALALRPEPAAVAWRPVPPVRATLDNGSTGVLEVLGNHRVAVGVGVAGVALLVAVVALGVSLSSLLVIGMVLLCPLGHVLMMRGHGSAEHGQQQAGNGGACHGGPAQQPARLDAPKRE